MNVYVVQTALEMAKRGVEVEIFTRQTSSDLPPVAELAPGVLVRHVVAGPFGGLGKEDLPSQLCAFTAGVLRDEAGQEPDWFDVVHSHYWLSGQVGWLLRDRWGVPLVHTAHTLAKVKNASLAEGDTPEPLARVVGEEQVVAEADRLVASTPGEADALIAEYGADPDTVRTVAPGVDLQTFTPGLDRDLARGRLAREAGVPIREDDVVLAFVGRIQPLKAPDVLLRAAAEMIARRPELRSRLRVLVVGGPSGSGLAQPRVLVELARELGIADVVSFLRPRSGSALAEVYRAADVVAVPSYSESFGLVALEAQACGTPVVAAAVGGLPVAVADGRSGLLVGDHSAASWADALERAALDRELRGRLAAGAVEHAGVFSWDRTADALLATYAEAAAVRRSGAAPRGVAV
jgi:D-inositol-3-phosphate glycosyltransferase